MSLLFACFLWIIGFPIYLAKRSEFKRINAGTQGGSQTTKSNPSHKSIGVIGWVGIGLLGLLIVGMLNSPDKSGRSSADSTSSTQSSADIPTAPEPTPLEVQSWRCDKESGFIFVRGEVKNISSGKLENVIAVAEFRTKDGELVKAEDALVDYNPIMPGQKSPFSAGGTDNPSIRSCQVAFKYLGGGSIPYIEKKKRK